MRPVLVLIAIALGALVLAACGSEGISVPEDDPAHEGAVLFAERCAGCHTMSAAGAEGSGQRDLRAQGPNLDEREVSFEDALFAIRNGGFSGAIMPQNIVVGKEAELLARFVAEFSGTDVEEEVRPGSGDGEGPAAGE